MSEWIIGIIALIGALVTGKLLLPWLIRLKVGQHIREDGPQSHLKKTGTPTMGGLFFLIPMGIVMLTEAMVHRRIEGVLMFLGIFGFAAIGFIDDYQKVVKKQNLGLTAKQKIILQFAVGLIIVLLYAKIVGEFSVRIPFLPGKWEIGFLPFVLFSVFVCLATVNSVNLTDGVDGLSTSVTIVVLLAFYSIGVKLGVGSELRIMTIASVGSLLGFLVFNRYPARVFMGDLGSLGLGGAVFVLALLSGLQWWIPIVGCIYFAEALSVIIQVVSFKTRGKRVFRMSPIHHHFELGGMTENQIVIRFSLIAILAGMIGYWAL
jgi:phospho-N-acetylmuramoyl-pentapeptide-transferase